MFVSSVDPRTSINQTAWPAAQPLAGSFTWPTLTRVVVCKRNSPQLLSPSVTSMGRKVASQPCATQPRPRSDLARTAPGATSRPKPGGNPVPPSDTRHPELRLTDPAARAPSARGWGMSHARRDRLSARLLSQGPQMRRECRSRAGFGAFCSVATLDDLALLPLCGRNWPYWGYYGAFSHFLISDDSFGGRSSHNL